MDLKKRNDDLEKLVKRIDITATMYKNAKEKYEAIAKYLNNNGIEANIYPQGSFRMGTVVKPYNESSEKDYDLDVICNLVIPKKTTDPENVKNQIGKALKDSDLYKDKLLPEEDRCWTLKYAKIDGEVGFSLDIVPSVDEASEVINGVVGLGVSSDLASEAIAITTKIATNYHWDESNPKGYAIWFDEINKPFLEFNREERRTQYFTENKGMFASVEDIPSNLERSSLQRVIQILKRHRDIYYSRTKKWDERPISAIITTLCSKISSNAAKDLSTFELLGFVVKELKVYSELLDIGQDIFEERYAERKFIKKENKKWTVYNPVNPNDIYTENWTKKTADTFFKWIDTVFIDVIENEEFGEKSYYSGLLRGFGYEGFSSIKDFLEPGNSNESKPVNLQNIKPWGEV